MISYILDNLIGIIGIIVGSFIAYHVYFLSKKINLKDKLVHKENIQKAVEPLLLNIKKGLSSKTELINTKKYIKYYPHNNKLNKNGYTYLRAELKSIRFDGIEFFCKVSELYKDVNGNFTLKNENESVIESKNVFEVGIIPYEWIEYVDPNGDEFSYRPQFFTSFNGFKNSPYKYIVYYVISDTYKEDGDPIEMKYKKIDIK